MKVIIYNNEEGQASIVYPIEGQALDKVIAKAVPPGVSYQVINKSDVPSDKTFRNALMVKNKTLEFDMPRARQIHMDRIRVDRDKKLKELDVEFIKALETGKNTAALVQQKQKLRNIPQTFNLNTATDIETLKRRWPDELN